MSDPDLNDLGATLTESFFRGLDRNAILAAIQKQEAGRDATHMLTAVWGITDPALLEKLAGLGLSAETVAAISLTPLVEVAWADGKVDQKERAAVLEAAGQYGLDKTDVSYLLLEGRLGERPGPELLETWHAYVRMLARVLDKPTLSILRGEIMARARDVASASGGILGFGSKISAVELEALDDLERAFS